MVPPINIILGLVALFDATLFWFIGQAVATGNLAKPVPPHLSDAEKADLERKNRLGGVAVMNAAPWLAVLGVSMMLLPLPAHQLLPIYIGGILGIVGWILYQVFAVQKGGTTDQGGSSDSGNDRDLPIR